VSNLGWEDVPTAAVGSKVLREIRFSQTPSLIKAGAENISICAHAHSAAGGNLRPSAVLALAVGIARLITQCALPLDLGI